MKKNVIIFGLIAGAIVSLFMMLSIAANANYTNSMVLGYTAMLLSFSFIFVGIKNFRDKYNGGLISFGKAFRIGFYITLIASTMYVITWLIDLYTFIPDFMDKYAAHQLEVARARGASATEIAKKTGEMASYIRMYKNPIYVILLTYMEILPVGVVVSLLTALFLKRKNPPMVTAQA